MEKARVSRLEMCTRNLSCPLCCQSNFPNIDALRISLLKVTSRPLKCPICADEVLGLDKLTIHLFGHSLLGQDEETGEADDKPGPITNQLKNERKSSKESSKEFANPSPSITAPVKTVQTIIVTSSMKCDVCGDEFRDHNLLRMHKSVFHEFTGSHGSGFRLEKVDNRYPCTMCSKTFKMKGSLKIHMRVVHLGYPRKGSSNTNTGVSNSSVPTNTISSVTVTPVYKSRDVISRIISNTVPIKPSNLLPPPLLPTTNLTTPPIQHLPQLHPLSPLSHPITLQSSPPPLQQSSTSSLPMPISESQIIRIIDPSQLPELIYLPKTIPASPTQPPPKSPLVESNFTNPIASPNVPSPKVENSVPSPSQPSPQSNAVGSGESCKQWECDVCLKSFTTKYFLKKHKRLHTGEMPYSCQICGKAFTFQQSYHKHLLYHSDEKPHVCAVCGRAFKELSTLHNHERIHSGKCFRQRVSYLVHRRIHTNTQPYKCTACDKSFRYKVSQRTHKCLMQPPGTVVRQPGDLLQKLLQSSSILPTLNETTPITHNDEPALSPLNVQSAPSPIEKPQPLDEDQFKSDEDINRTLDELLNESYDKMGIGADQANNLYSPDGSSTIDSTAPSAVGSQAESSPGNIVPRIENLCLLSPGSRTMLAYDSENMEMIDSIKLDLLYN
ncbi:zinc finger protein 236 isoform X2 [Uranotaenia lowii]|uniref:zinc finger protein 236 isoform X2 n=1 Tax=Uranotaenia lowii TaxID=190385 RepID=UPI00247A67D2|nr:zinc finger protein 236 isoform X2 [Uranotaenia lowii]